MDDKEIYKIEYDSVVHSIAHQGMVDDDGRFKGFIQIDCKATKKCTEFGYIRIIEHETENDYHVYRRSVSSGDDIDKKLVLKRLHDKAISAGKILGYKPWGNTIFETHVSYSCDSERMRADATEKALKKLKKECVI